MPPSFRSSVVFMSFLISAVFLVANLFYYISNRKAYVIASRIIALLTADKIFATANILSMQREDLRSSAIIFGETIYKLEQQEKEARKMSIRIFLATVRSWSERPSTYAS